MADSYVALRVPISLLHQKVYPTGHRLEKWMGVLLNEKREVVVIPKVDASRVISPSAAPARMTQSDSQLGAFDEIPYLRRFFSYCDGYQRLTCRYCNGVTRTSADRGNHSDCFKFISVVLRNLVDDGLCVICEKPIDKILVSQEYNAVPVCSENCLSAWDWMSPDAFDLELGIVKQGYVNSVVQSSKVAIRNHFGDRHKDD